MPYRSNRYDLSSMRYLLYTYPKVPEGAKCVCRYEGKLTRVCEDRSQVSYSVQLHVYAFGCSL